MTLLTLEEIEAIENSAKENNDQWNETVLRLEKVVGLLATARAYWEEKETYPYELPVTEESEDKPHAPTIRAIVEALRESWEEGGERNNGHTVVFPGYKIDRAIKSLEKHLE